MPKFKSWVEIPVEVEYDEFPEEGDGRTEPHYPARLEIVEIKFAGFSEDDNIKDLQDYLWFHMHDKLYDEAVEDNK
jgi:hypothetical protein